MTEISTDAATTTKESLGDRLKRMIAEYGPLALTIYLVIFAIVMVAAAAAIQFGVPLDGVAADVGALAGAWVIAKLTQPFRILATLALTPVVAKLLGRTARTP